MTINSLEWDFERKRLNAVVGQIEKQLIKQKNEAVKYGHSTAEANRSMWDETPHVIRSLDDAAKAKQYGDLLKLELMTYAFAQKQLKRLEKIYSSPYFGRIDFCETGSNQTEQIYVGTLSLAEEKTMDYLIYDWRAPICSLFYDSETGAVSYQCPAGLIEGIMPLKRQYRIINRQIEYMFDSSLKIDDEILQEILGKSTDDKMKTIVTTIQREQNKVIRDDIHMLLVVQGPAGSGKTSIALHRIAYLLYRHREAVTSKNMVIFSPNSIFNDYISDVLPELGEENVHQTTFREYMEKAIGSSYILESANDQMEYLLSRHDDPQYGIRLNSIKYKSSKDFIQVIKNYIKFLETGGTGFEDIVYGSNTIISGKEIEELFHNDYSYLPLAKRLEKIKNRICFLLEPFEKERVKELEEELAGSGGYSRSSEAKIRSEYLVKEELRPLKESIEEKLLLNPFSLYCSLFSERNLFVQISAGTSIPDNLDEILVLTSERLDMHQIGYEDAAPLLLLKYMAGYTPGLSEIRHVVIDEAQDYTPVQYELFKQLFPQSSLTLLGDLNQSINPYMNVGIYQNVLDIMGSKNAAVITLNRSYRSTHEISMFSQAVLSEQESSEPVKRPGAKPCLVSVNNENVLPGLVVDDILKLREEGMNSIAVICKTAAESLSAYEQLKERVRLHLVTKDDTEFNKGITVIPSYLAKGLEFDAVIIYNAGENVYNREDERKLFYTACTRALHHLHIYYTGKLSPFLSKIDPGLYEYLRKEDTAF